PGLSQTVNQSDGPAKSVRWDGAGDATLASNRNHRDGAIVSPEAEMSVRVYTNHGQERPPWAYSMTLPRPDETNDGSLDPRIVCALALLTLGYLLPWAIATVRRRDDAGTIGMINLLAGWTVVGWVVSLGMALRRRSAR
ncbi:MAG TPA: superinfection immunity protein, partial [Micromonosporaceae bacterium]